MPARFLTYQCRYCPRQDRRYRMVAHVLKEHIPRENAPYFCTLCNFRCQEAKTLQDHITDYAPHRREEEKRGTPDYGRILQYSRNPAKVEDYFYVMNRPADGDQDEVESLARPLDMINQHGRVLPRWIVDRDVPQPPKIQRQTSPPEYVPTPRTTLSMPIIGFDALLEDSPFDEDAFQDSTSLQPPVTGALPSASDAHKGISSPWVAVQLKATPGKRSVTASQKTPSVKPPPSKETIATPPVTNSACTKSGLSTPLQDEPFYLGVMPTLEDANDPLLREAEDSGKRKQNSNPGQSPKRQRLESQDIIAEAISKATSQICKALEEQQQVLKAIQQAMSKHTEEYQRLERRTNNILKFLEDRFAPAQQRSPKVKSTVFKRR